VQRVATSAGLPRWIYLPAAVGALFVVVPLIAVAAKVDWPHFWSLITTKSSTTALMLSLETADAASFRFPDDLWARVVWDFALGHHYTVIRIAQSVMTPRAGSLIISTLATPPSLPLFPLATALAPGT